MGGHSRHGQSGQGGHEHVKLPIEVATGKVLDIDRDDLGHPDDPGMWARLYQHCAIGTIGVAGGPPATSISVAGKVGTLRCGNCAEDSPLQYLYLTVRNDQRHVSAYSLAQARAAGLVESDEHHALKDTICRLAEREGLHAEQEQADARRRRRTDVLVRGGNAEVGWEVQLSGIDRQQLGRRIGYATSDGLVSSWLTMDKSTGFTSVIDRAPAVSLKDLTALEIATSGDLRIFQGVKRLQVVPCTWQRGERWHRELACVGHHAQPAPLDPAHHPSLAQMITASASGAMVTIRWPRKYTAGHDRPWLWVPRADADIFYDVEAPCITRAGLPRPVTPTAPGTGAGRHIAPTAWDPSPTDTVTDNLAGATVPSGWVVGTAGAGLGAALGDQCPRCGWTRNQHRWDCTTGLSTIRQPQFQQLRLPGTT